MLILAVRRAVRGGPGHPPGVPTYGIDRQRSKKPWLKKKQDEKALIPLPPTGFASVFYANPNVVQTILQPRRAVGLCRGLAIAQNERFGREMQRGCTAAQRTVTNGGMLECPDSLGEKLENTRKGVFSKSGSIKWRPNFSVGRLIRFDLQAPWSRAGRPIAAFRSVAAGG